MLYKTEKREIKRAAISDLVSDVLEEHLNTTPKTEDNTTSPEDNLTHQDNSTKPTLDSCERVPPDTADRAHGQNNKLGRVELSEQKLQQYLQKAEALPNVEAELAQKLEQLSQSSSSYHSPSTNINCLKIVIHHPSKVQVLKKCFETYVYS